MDRKFRCAQIAPVDKALCKESITEMQMEHLETAYHEAGHAVLSIVLKFRSENISLRKKDEMDGSLRFEDYQPDPGT